MKFLIKRVAMTSIAVFGVLIGPDGIPFTNTVERPWLDNQSGVSCIPAGHYTAKRCRRSPDYGYADSPKFGNTFQVMDVPGRQFILFHKANLASDLHGCIAVGEKFAYLNGVPGIAESAAGYDEFMSMLAGVDEFELEIREV